MARTAARKRKRATSSTTSAPSLAELAEQRHRSAASADVTNPDGENGNPHWAFGTTLAGVAAFAENLEREGIPFAGPRRHGKAISAVSVYFLDIDGNDVESVGTPDLHDDDRRRPLQARQRYGTATEGDKALQLIAGSIQSTLRVSDYVCRYGGEEFAILLPQTDLDQAVLAGGGRVARGPVDGLARGRRDGRHRDRREVAEWHEAAAGAELVRSAAIASPRPTSRGARLPRRVAPQIPSTRCTAG